MKALNPQTGRRASVAAPVIISLRKEAKRVKFGSWFGMLFCGERTSSLCESCEMDMHHEGVVVVEELEQTLESM